ncbi:MAG TPA: hypothetical protein VJL89_12285 [Thermodesulfovibrionia bacterium]|nr:hypothetical protein [Thermodesulfovibrionia bacterium]
MNTLTQYLKEIDSKIDVAKLPEEAQQELIRFYKFLVFKYEQQVIIKSEKHRILTKIFQEADGKLPQNYTFDR